MSDNGNQTQNRPSRRSNAPSRRANSSSRRSYSSDRSTTSSRDYSSDGSYPSSRRASTAYDEPRESRYIPSSDRERTSSRETQSVSEGMFSSLKGAVSDGREAISSRISSDGDGQSPLQKFMDVLPDNVWVKRAIIIAIALILVLILANLVTCIAGALGGGTSSASSSAASTASASASTASGSSAASGSAATQTQGVASPWTEDGTFTTGDSTLDKYIKDLCDKYSTDGKKFDENAYDTYIYVSRTDYIERENNQSPWGPNWDVEYAKQYFEEGNTGNCYNYAAVVEYVLKYFGYSDAEAEPCVVGLESGSWGDHGLVFVTNKADNNKRCLIDSSLSANGWMLDADSYSYDIRNINQNSTIQGNVDVLNDNDTPTRIPAGELTETNSSGSAASADSENATGNETNNTTSEEDEEPVYVEESVDDDGSYVEEVYYEEDTDAGYDEGGDGGEAGGEETEE